MSLPLQFITAMRIDTVHDYILFELDKASRGYVSHEEIDRVLNLTQMNEFSMLVKGAGITQQVHDDLAPFKKVIEYTADEYTAVGDLKTGTQGIVVLPADYMHLLHMRTETARLEIVSDHEVGDRLDSQIITSTFASRQGVGGESMLIPFTTHWLQLYPKTGLALTITYLRRPAVPVYAYTVVDRVTIFDPITSVNLEWNDEATNRIINRTLSSLGVHLQAADVTQFMEVKTQNP